MKLSCASPIVPGESLTEKANWLYKNGFEGIMVMADRDSWTQEKMAEVETLQEKTGIKPCEFVFGSDNYGHLMSDDPVKASATMKLYTETAEICAKIGAITELEYLYGAQIPLPLFDIYNQMTDEQETAFIKAYTEVCQPVVGTEALVLIEGINRYESPFMNSIIDCKKVIDKMPVKEVGVLADFFHMSIEESDIANSIEQMDGAIKHVHLGDSNRLMPGKGSIDWVAGFRALKKQQYMGFVNLECSTMGNPEKAIPEAASFLKKLIAEV